MSTGQIHLIVDEIYLIPAILTFIQVVGLGYGKCLCSVVDFFFIYIKKLCVLWFIFISFKCCVNVMFLMKLCFSFQTNSYDVECAVSKELNSLKRDSKSSLKVAGIALIAVSWFFWLPSIQ